MLAVVNWSESPSDRKQQKELLILEVSGSQLWALVGLEREVREDGKWKKS